MNQKTKTKYELAKLYEYVTDIDNFCQRYDYDFQKAAADKLSYNAVLMMIIQLGVRAVHIRDTDPEFFKECPLPLAATIRMRNKVTHGYTQINREMFLDVLKNDVPFFKSYIEKEVLPSVLSDSYILYDYEYEDLENYPDLVQ